MTSREVHVAAVARGDGDAKAGAGATVSEEETPAAPQRAAREKYVAAWLKGSHARATHTKHPTRACRTMARSAKKRSSVSYGL